MKKVILFVLGILLSIGSVFADSCFIAKENGKVLQSEGAPEKHYPPMSTFKIALSLMGYDSGILKDETHPKWSF